MPEAAEQDAINNLVQGNELATTLDGLMILTLILEPSTSTCPYIGKNTTHHPMKAYHGHVRANGLMLRRAAQKTDLPSAATRHFLLSQELKTSILIRIQSAPSALRLQPNVLSSTHRLHQHALRAESDFANISVPDKEYHFDWWQQRMGALCKQTCDISIQHVHSAYHTALTRRRRKLSTVWNTLAQNIADEALAEKTP